MDISNGTRMNWLMKKTGYKKSRETVPLRDTSMRFLMFGFLHESIVGTVKSPNVGNGVWFGNGTSIHIIPTGYLINWFSEKC